MGDVCDTMFPVYTRDGRVCALVVVAVADRVPDTGAINTVVMLVQTETGWELWSADSIAGRHLRWQPRFGNNTNDLEPLEILVQKWAACFRAEAAGLGGAERPRIQYAGLLAPCLHPSPAQMKTLFSTFKCPYDTQAEIDAMRVWLENTTPCFVLTETPAAVPRSALADLAPVSTCLACMCPTFNPQNAMCGNLHTVCSTHMSAYLADVCQLLDREPTWQAAPMCPSCKAPIAADTLISAVIHAHRETKHTSEFQRDMDAALHITMRTLGIQSYGQLASALAEQPI